MSEQLDQLAKLVESLTFTTNIRELIAEHCPDGVEFKPILSLADFIRGATYSKSSEHKNGSCRVLRANNITFGKDSLNFDSVVNVDLPDSSKINSKLQINDILISISSGSRDQVGKVAFIDTELDYFFGGFMAVLRTKLGSSEVKPKYLFYYLCSSRFKEIIFRNLAYTTINNINNRIMKSVMVPVPPIPVQEEIVRILDAFTNLEAELEAELEAREKQYNYYREQLLDFSSLSQPILTSLSTQYRQKFPAHIAQLLIELCPQGVVYKPLGECINIRNGKDHKHLASGQYPVYGSGGIMRYVDDYLYDSASVLLPRKGSLKNTFYCDSPFWTVDTIYYTEIDENQLLPKFFYYFMKVQDLESLNTAGGVPSLTQTVLKRIAIPLPPIPVQEEIVKILDSFESLIGDAKTGIRAELAARKAQYSHYRENLLSFKEK